MNRNIFILLILFVIFGCNDELKPQTKTDLDGWELICLDLNNTGKRYIISSKHDTLTAVNYKWKTVSLPDSTEAMVRKPDSRIKSKMSSLLKDEIVSETIDLFKQSRPFTSFDTKPYSANNSYVLVVSDDTVLQYHFHYNNLNGVESDPKLSKLIQLFKQRERINL